MGQVATKGEFTYKGLTFTGYSLHGAGNTFNGFACPYFERDVAEGIVNIVDADPYMYWDRDEQTFIELSEEGFKWPIEAIELDTEDGLLSLYPIGTQMWEWEENL